MLVAVAPTLEPSVSIVEDFAYTLLSVTLAYGCWAERTPTWTTIAVATVLYPFLFNALKRRRA